MARIFSIQFRYENIEHTVMVSMRTTPFFNEYAVIMLDETISDLLPNNKIISTSKESFIFSDSTQENAPLLMQAILQAIIHHVHAINA